MGFGNLINAGAQNSLTSLQNQVNSIGGNMQLGEANQEATALENEATNVYQQSQVEAMQANIQGQEAYGQQKETYASSGVDMRGSPVAMLNQTQMETSIQVGLIQEQGSLQQNLLATQAMQTQEQGYAAWMSSEGEDQINDQENALNQANEENAIKEQIFEGLFGFGAGAAEEGIKGYFQLQSLQSGSSILPPPPP